MKRLGSIAEGIEHHSGLHAREPLDRINLEDLVHVLREIQDDRDVAALAGKARPCAAGQHRGAEFPADGNCRHDVIAVTRNDEADRDLSIVRAVGGIERTAGAVEAHLAAYLPLQLTLEFGGFLERVDGFRVRAEGQWRDHYPIATGALRHSRAVMIPPSL